MSHAKIIRYTYYDGYEFIQYIVKKEIVVRVGKLCERAKKQRQKHVTPNIINNICHSS